MAQSVTKNKKIFVFHGRGSPCHLFGHFSPDSSLKPVSVISFVCLLFETWLGLMLFLLVVSPSPAAIILFDVVVVPTYYKLLQYYVTILIFIVANKRKNKVGVRAINSKANRSTGFVVLGLKTEAVFWFIHMIPLCDRKLTKLVLDDLMHYSLSSYTYIKNDRIEGCLLFSLYQQNHS